MVTQERELQIINQDIQYDSLSDVIIYLSSVSFRVHGAIKFSVRSVFEW